MGGGQLWVTDDEGEDEAFEDLGGCAEEGYWAVRLAVVGGFSGFK